MEVIYYMRNYYPLTAAQKMHHNWIMDYGTQQVSGVSVVASVQAELDFGLLKKCIQMETERSGCTRVRFTKPDKDGNVKQYIEKQDSRDIELKDLSGMESLAKADELMQQWAYETFDGDNIPMCEFIMLKLPEGYNGFFLHMDHRLIDSCGLVVMIGDLFQLYTYYKYGTAYPQELADFETVLKKDLAKAGNEKRFAKDKKFWDDQLDALGEPLYSDIQGPSVLEEARKRHGNPKLRSSDIEMKDLFVAVKDYYLEPGPTKNLIDFCKNNGRRLIQISTVSVAGEGSDGVPPMSRVFCENDLYIGQNITNEYIRTKFLAERAVLEAVSEGLDGKVVRVGNLMSRNSDGEFQINFITNGFLRSLRGYAAVGKFPMGGMHEVAEFSPIDSTALAVLRLAQTDRRFTVFHACNSHHIYMADLIYAMRSYGFRIDIVRDEEFEAAVKEFAKTGQDSDAVSGLIAYTSHNENEIYTIDYSNRFTAQVLYRLDYKWPVTDDRYLENAIAALDRLTFFD